MMRTEYSSQTKANVFVLPKVTFTRYLTENFFCACVCVNTQSESVKEQDIL